MQTIKLTESKTREPNKRRTEITIETRSLTIIRMTSSEGKSNFTDCRNCRTNAASFRGAHAALIFQVAVAELERLSQNGQIHRAENGDLCGNSLAAFFTKDVRYVED